MVSIMAERRSSQVKKSVQQSRSQKKPYVQKQNKIARIFVSLILIVFMAVMTIQIQKVYDKQQEYVAKQAQLEQQLEDEKARKAELLEYKEYIESRDYIEDVAKSKLGLLYGNEIIFREDND